MKWGPSSPLLRQEAEASENLGKDKLSALPCDSGPLSGAVCVTDDRQSQWDAKERGAGLWLSLPSPQSFLWGRGSSVKPRPHCSLDARHSAAGPSPVFQVSTQDSSMAKAGLGVPTAGQALWGPRHSPTKNGLPAHIPVSCQWVQHM